MSINRTESEAEGTNFALRAGRWSAAHWKTATFGWLGFVAVAFALGMTVGTHALAQSDSLDGEAGRASSALGHAGFKQPASETVLVESGQLAAADPRFRAAVGDVVRAVSHAPNVANVRAPYKTDGQISKSGRAAIVRFDLPGDSKKTASKRVKPVLAAVAA